MRRLPILVIEEDAELARYIAHLIDRLGHKPYTARSIGEALRLIAARDYALVLADYFNPLEKALYRWPTIEMVSRFAPHTPVLAISALEEAPAGDNIVGVLPLPFDEDHLAQQLKRHVSTQLKQARDPVLARYLAALWDADVEKSAEVVDEALATGWSIEAIHEDLFTAALYAIGDLWGADSCMVADEHGARAITERMMAKVATIAPKQQAKGHRILIACMVGERHELGARMVTDQFAWAGWTTRFLGADIPEGDVVAEACRRQVEVVGLSATVRPSWGVIKAQIAVLRDAGVSRIILGGQAFQTMDPGAVDALGADALADSARCGVKVVNDLLKRGEAA